MFSVLISNWLYLAIASAFFAALTALFGKIGVNEIPANMATFIRTIVILVVTALLITMRDQWEPVDKISRIGAVALVLSGIATGLSWLCYYRALQLAPASQVAPIDKLSVVFVIILSALFLGEALTWKLITGAGLILAGAVIIAI